MRPLAALLALAALPLLATFAPRSIAVQSPLPKQARIWFEPLPLAPDEPGRRRVGRLVYLGGWALRSNDRRFGGMSAVHVEGGEVTGVSDAGSHFRFRLPAGGRNVAALEVGALSDRVGGKRARDAEAMAITGDQLWVAFERTNSVERFDRTTWRMEASAAPPSMRTWRANTGAEALVRLEDGRFLVLSEGRSGTDRPTQAVLFAGDPAVEGMAAVRLRYAPPAGFRATDAAELADGRLLILNRRFSVLDGFSAKIVLADPSGLAEGAVLKGEEIAHLEPPLTVDNMEGISIGREGGRTIVWLASDDNFIDFQRSLLLKFALAE
jgi:hypothetical protein